MALVMTYESGTLRRRSPAILMQALNESLLERKVDAQYATLLVALWESRSRLLTISAMRARYSVISWRNGEILKPSGGRCADWIAGGSTIRGGRISGRGRDCWFGFSRMALRISAKEEDYSRGCCDSTLKSTAGNLLLLAGARFLRI